MTKNTAQVVTLSALQARGRSEPKAYAITALDSKSTSSLLARNVWMLRQNIPS
jgi:hypothetical protein